MNDLQNQRQPEPLQDDLLEVDEAQESDQVHYSEELNLTVTAEEAGQRLDAFLASRLSEHSRSRIQQWIASGLVGPASNPMTKGSASVVAGQTYVVRVPLPQAVEDWQPEPIAIDLVFEDEELLVLNKPIHQVVHPAAGNWSGTLLNGLLYHWPELKTLPRAGIVHRLDRDTSGLMVVAKTLTSQTSLVRQLQNKSVFRHYLAVCWHRPAAGHTSNTSHAGLMKGRVDAPIGRHPNDRQRMAIVNGQNGKRALTHYQVLDSGSLETQPVRLLGCRLETGRTHQIRVHLQFIGYPIIGDPTYHHGAPRQTRPPISRQALHARCLGLIKPSNGKALFFEHEPPQDFMDLVQAAGMALPAVDRSAAALAAEIGSQ